MRGNRMGSAVLLGALGIAFIPAAYAQRDGRKVTEYLPGDPDAGLPMEVIPPLEEGSFSLLAGCESIGGATVNPITSFVLRGNAFRITRASDLTEIQMELDFGTPLAPVMTNVSFSIHQNTGTSTNPIWHHLWSQNPVIPIVGTGRKFYSSGLVTPPTLAVNKEYAIAVTWGAVNIRYFRDQLAYPRAYSDGQVLGAVGQFIAAGPPVDPATDFFFLPFASGAYSMKLCITPKPGACCNGTTCSYVTESTCLSVNGAFSEELLTCSALTTLEMGCPLDPGACCRGEVCSVLDRFECDRQGGSWSANTACSLGGDNPCLPKGACCHPTGVCTELSEENCVAAPVHGVFQGDGTTCAGAGSSCQLGACCVDALCNYVSRTSCGASGGLWRGAGTVCSGDLCDPTGACCDADQCVGEAVTFDDCSVLNGYQGDWTSCSSLSVACGLGACCTAEFGCFGDLDPSTCDILNGTFADGSSCDELNPPCAGVCCFAAPNFTSCLANATPSQCNSLQGKFVGYVTPPTGTGQTICTNNPNPPCPGGPVGRCCMATTGACFRSDNTGCTEMGGTFSTGVCSPNTCPQPGPPVSCCLPNGNCVELIAAKCTAEGGVPGGPGSQCSLELCATGACCPGTGGICTANSTIAACSGVNDLFFFGRTCGQPGGITCPPVGACCMPNGTCQQITRLNCQNQNGIYAGDHVNCTGNPQCARSSCCLTDGSCVTTIPSECNALSGNFDASTPSCSSAACGACCTNGSCAVVSDNVCQGTSIGLGTVCSTNPPPCLLGSCCVRDGSCSDGLTLSECNAVFGLFAGGQTCLSAPCAATGACCQTDESCDLIMQSFCASDNGLYRGDNSVCIAGECDRGTCCLPVGGCTDTIASQCTAMSGEFFAGNVCAIDACPATGACCVNGACQIQTPFGCTALGGIFTGSATCTAGLCTRGTCCDGVGNCADTIPSFCPTGSDFINGGVCANSPCPPVGACCKVVPDPPTNPPVPPLTTCEILRQSTCQTQGGSYAGNGTNCTQNHCAYGACCSHSPGCIDNFKFVCLTQVSGGVPFPGLDCGRDAPCVTGSCCRLSGCTDSVRQALCTGPDDTFDPTTICNNLNPACLVRGACCDVINVCRLDTMTSCVSPNVYFGDGISCTPDPCSPIMIVGSNPPSKAIDARQPHDIASAMPAQGFTDIDVTFDGDASMLTTADFTITQSGGDATPPALAGVTSLSPMVVRLTFVTPIDPLAWTVIQHTQSGSQTCIGFLPGDVSGNGLVETADVSVLSGDLNTPVLPIHAVDTDRSSAATAEDILQLMNLLNGGGVFSPVLGVSLPASPCP